MAFPPRTLKGQLTLIFLALTLVPSLTLTVISTHRLLAALERWENPGVQRALEGSLEVARDLMNLTRNDLRQRGQLLGADEALEPPRRKDAVRDRLATAYNLDFVQLYDLDGTLLFQATRDTLLAPPGRLPGVRALARSDNPFYQDPSRGLLAYVGYAGEPGKSEWILVSGIYLDPALFNRLEDLSRGVAYYRQLGVLKRVNQKAVLVGLALVVVGLAVGATVIARRLAVRVSRPVENLGRGMERVRRGEESVRVRPEGSAEVEALIRTFNAMSAELSRSRRALARAERLTGWQEVARRVAHEMKNALTPITFSLHRLKKLAPELPEPGRAQASLETVLGEVEGLQRLAASFSELARLPVAEFAPVDLRGVIEASAEGLEGTRILWKPPPRPVMVDADKTLLRQALGNVLKNASEAMERGGTIWIELEATATLARVIVEDDGPGWPEGARDSALEPYFTTKNQGSGLGLSIVQRTLLQHGGTLELDERAGGGARVILSLPLAGDPPVRAGNGKEPG